MRSKSQVLNKGFSKSNLQYIAVKDLEKRNAWLYRDQKF